MTTFVVRPQSRHAINATKVHAAIAFWRLLILVGLFAIFLLLIVGRLATLALFEGSRAFGATPGEFVPERGDIVDRNGAPLAGQFRAMRFGLSRLIWSMIPRSWRLDWRVSFLIHPKPNSTRS